MCRNPGVITTSLNIEELLTLSARTVDSTDTVLGKISQLEHTLQLAALVQNYGTNWILAALLHDLGKCAGNYHPKYAVHIMGSACMIEGVGFDESKPTLRYSHSEWAYRRFKDKIPKESSDLIRFHNVCHNGLQNISRSNPELAKKIIIFKETELYAKELYGQSMQYSEALTFLKSFFKNEKFSI